MTAKSSPALTADTGGLAANSITQGYGSLVPDRRRLFAFKPLHHALDIPDGRQPRVAALPSGLADVTLDLRIANAQRPRQREVPLPDEYHAVRRAAGADGIAGRAGCLYRVRPE